MIYFWQKDWFGIEFASFSDINANVLPTNDFYKSFYKQFYKKFSSYNDLPYDWKKEKLKIVSFLLDIVKDKTNILSIGCGNGFIETELAKQSLIISGGRGGQIVAIDPSVNSSNWIVNDSNISFINGYFPSDIKNIFSCSKFDFAYISYIDYVLNNEDYINIIQSIKNYPINDFIFIGLCIYKPNFILLSKYFIKRLLSKFGFYKAQLWGYQRTINEHLAIFKKAGFSNISYGCIDGDIFWIRSKND